MKKSISILIAMLIVSGSVLLLFDVLAPETALATPTFSCADVTGMPQTDCEALVALYNNTEGANWTDNTDWLVTNTPCDWYGISCAWHGAWTINLDYNNLSGTIPAELGNITMLASLTIEGNSLSGPLPPELGNFTDVYNIDISDNQLTGTIPTQVGNLSSLRLLDLSGNQLTGSVPGELGNLTDAEAISLDENLLTGTIPTQVGNLSSVELFSLGSNQLTGTIPAELGDLPVVTFLGSLPLTCW